MKHTLLILLIFICVKVNAQSDSTQTQYGIICGSCNDKVAAVRALGCNWIRVIVDINDYDGKNILKRYFDSGLNVIVTVKWSEVDTFSVDTSIYKSKLENFIVNNINSSHELFIVVGNEQLNKEHNFGYAKDYVNRLNASVSVASKYNLKISDGGLTFSPLKAKIYVSTMDAHLWDDANKFASMCIPKETIKKLQNPASNMWDEMLFLDTVIAGMAKISYPNFYTNFHYYAPAYYAGTGDTSITNAIEKDPGYILKTTVTWLIKSTNRDSLHIISNEMGQLNLSAKLLRSELRNASKNNVQIIIWHAGNDISVGLFSDYTTLRLGANGNAFKKFIIKKHS